MGWEGAAGFMRGFNAGGRSGVGRFFDSYYRAQDRREAKAAAERQADMQNLQYFTSILDKDLPEGMHQTAFESIKGLMKKNSKTLGISADYDWDSLKWDNNNKTVKGAHKKLKNLLAETKKINPDTGEPMVSMADAEIGIREIGLELTGKKRTGFYKTAEAAIGAAKETRRQKEAKNLQMLSIYGADNFIRQAAKGETSDIEGLGVKIIPGETAAEKREAELDFAKRLKKWEADLNVKESGPRGLDPNQQRLFYGDLRSYIDRQFGWSDQMGWTGEDRSEEMAQVQDIARKVIDAPHIDQETGALRYRTIPEAYLYAKAGVKRSKTRKTLGKLPARGGGFLEIEAFGGNKPRTSKIIEQAYKAGAGPKETVKELVGAGWKDRELAELARKHKEVDVIAGKLEQSKPSQAGWYDTDSMPGIEFYWDGQEITNIRTL
jgi:hypothetical protein